MSTPQTPAPAPNTLPRSEWLGPVFRWELTSTARRARYFRLRMLYAGILLFLLWSNYSIVFPAHLDVAPNIQSFARFAEAFLGTFVTAQFFIALAITPAIVATTLPSEKERKTIEYLFVSSLTDREIVVGKVIARIMTLMMILLVGVPVVAFAGIFGGIDYFSLLIVTVSTLAVVASVASLSFLVSIYCSTTRQSLSNCYIVLFFLMVALPLLIALGIQAGDHVLRIIAPDWPQLAENLIANPLIQRSLATIALAHPLSPMFLLIMSMQAFGSAPIPINYLFPALIIIHLSMAGCFIVWSSRRLRKAHRAQETRAAQKSQKDSGQNLTPRRSRHVYDWSPLFWKEIAVGKGRRTTLLVRILLFLGIAVFYYNVIDQGLNRGFHDNDMRLSLSMGSVLLVGIGFLMVAFRSASSIGEERDRDCWVSLLAAPVTASEIVRAKVFGSLQPLGLYLLLVSPLLIISLLIGTLSIIGLAMWLAVVGIYGTLISSIGVYHSLCQKTTMRAIGVTLITCASFCGVGQAFLLPILMWDDNTGQLIAGSMPWVALVCAANLNNFRSDMDHEVVFWVIVFLVGYLLVSLGIIARTIGIFGRITERYDTPQQPAGEPRPPLPPTSSLPSPASP